MQASFSVRWTRRLLPVALGALLAGCAASQDQPPVEMEQMTVGVEFRPVHRCSRISPEMTVAYAPKGTKFYKVRLVEYGDGQERYLGGGQWSADESGLIPEGALSTHYMGPCPPAGQPREYAYIITAMSSLEEPPLAESRFRFSPE